MKSNKATLALSFLLISAGWASPAASSTGSGNASLSMPVRGVWMHPGFFGPDHTAAVELMLRALTEGDRSAIRTRAQVDAIGHRIVHGGEGADEPLVVNDEVLAHLGLSSTSRPCTTRLISPASTPA